MLRRLAVVLAVSALGVGLASRPATADVSPPPTHIGSTFDVLDRGVLHIQDHSAVTADVSAKTVLVPTSNTACDEYTTTYTITWTARDGHLLTSVIEHYDDFSLSYTALGTKTFSMTPDAVVRSDQSPTISRWFVKGTHKRDPKLCPRDIRVVNHVEIWVDGKQRHPEPSAIVRPPSREHLAAVWQWRTDVDIVKPARVDVTLNTYRETGTGDTCYSVQTELDVNVTAIGSNRIIAVGVRAPGQDIAYQRGDAASWGLGIVGQSYFLNGTHKKSRLCPRDTLSQDRIEIYTEATSHHHDH